MRFQRGGAVFISCRYRGKAESDTPGPWAWFLFVEAGGGRVASQALSSEPKQQALYVLVDLSTALLGQRTGCMTFVLGKGVGQTSQGLRGGSCLLYGVRDIENVQPECF